MMVYQFSRFDRESNRELWRYRSPVSLWVEWLAAWLERVVRRGWVIVRGFTCRCRPGI